MNPRIAAPWGLATLACAAIFMGFRANETGPQPAEAARADQTVRVAAAVASLEDHDVTVTASFATHDAAVVPVEEKDSNSDSDCRAHAAVLQTLHGVGDGTSLRRAQFSRGEPGLLMTKDAASAARARVTPGALPSKQPPVSSAL